MRSLVLHPGQSSERRVPLLGPVVSIGRVEDNDIVLGHLSTSRRHARIETTGEEVTILDLESRNGTWVNGRRVQRAPLHTGDEVRLGDVDMRYDGGSLTSFSSTVEFSPSAANSFGRLLGRGPSSLNLPTAERDARMRDKLQLLLEASEQLASLDTVDNVLHRIVGLVGRVFDVDRISVLMLDEAGVLVERAGRHPPGTGAAAYSQTIARYIADRRVAAVFMDTQLDERVRQSESIADQVIRSSMAAPLIAHDQLLGVLYVDNLYVAERFTEEDLQFLGGLAAQAALAIENGLLYQRIAREAVLRQNLLRFFPEAIATRILANEGSGLPTVDVEATVLFCDITDFTGLSARLPPREVVEVLNIYFPQLAEVVFRHQGTLEKYIGDALVAVWGAPFAMADDADRALRAAVEIQRGLVIVNERLASRGVSLAVHVGLNTGRVAAGNIGSERYVQYAAIGDATNVSARLCGLARAGEIVMAETTRVRLRGHHPPLVDLGLVDIRGKALPVGAWRVEWEASARPTLLP